MAKQLQGQRLFSFLRKESPKTKHEDSSDNLILDFPLRTRSTAIHQQQQQQHRQQNLQHFLLKPNKTVRFSSTSTLHIMEPTDLEDNKATWYSKKDYSRFRRIVKMDAQYARDQFPATSLEHLPDFKLFEDLESHDWSIRGIEHLVCKPLTLAIIQSNDFHRSKVIQEYKRLVGENRGGNDGVYDVKALRKVSRCSSRWGKQRALRK